MPDSPSIRARRTIVVLSTLTASLAVAVVVLALRGDHGGGLHPSLLSEAGVQEAAVARLLEGTVEVFDSHPDATVSRVLLPNVQGVEFKGTSISSNAFGMREKAYSLPKPDGLTRVVLLGDSFVFGLGVEARERLGVFLEERLRDAGATEVEVLHIGIGSWNLLAECAFVHRQLTRLAPDLVIQVFVSNDLDDNVGVRGFGTRSNFDPARPERASGIVRVSYPTAELGAQGYNPLLLGLDGESRARMDGALEAIESLAEALEARGARYLLLDTVGGGLGRPWWVRLRERLSDERLLLLDPSFMADPRFRISAGDAHWNPAGHAEVARLLYAVIQERDLLPQLELAPWPEARAVIEERHGYAVERMEQAEAPEFDPGPELRRPHQIYGGLDRERQVAPYASFVLAPGGNGRLVLGGRFLDAAELASGRVRVRVDGEPVGELTLRASGTFEERFDVPAHLVRRSLVAVQLQSDAWVLEGENARRCVSFQLDSARFEAGD